MRVLTEATGNVEIDVPPDRAGTFKPQIVRMAAPVVRCQRGRLSVYAKGLTTTGEISAHFALARDPWASASKVAISRITDKVLEEMNEWATRPLEEIQDAVFIDGIVVKVRGRSPTARSTPRSGRAWTGSGTSPGTWAGTGGNGAKSARSCSPTNGTAG